MFWNFIWGHIIKKEATMQWSWSALISLAVVVAVVLVVVVVVVIPKKDSATGLKGPTPPDPTPPDPPPDPTPPDPTPPDPTPPDPTPDPTPPNPTPDPTPPDPTPDPTPDPRLNAIVGTFMLNTPDPTQNTKPMFIVATGRIFDDEGVMIDDYFFIDSNGSLKYNDNGNVFEVRVNFSPSLTITIAHTGDTYVRDDQWYPLLNSIAGTWMQVPGDIPLTIAASGRIFNQYGRLVSEYFGIIDGLPGLRYIESAETTFPVRVDTDASIPPIRRITINHYTGYTVYMYHEHVPSTSIPLLTLRNIAGEYYKDEVTATPQQLPQVRIATDGRVYTNQSETADSNYFDVEAGIPKYGNNTSMVNGVGMQENTLVVYIGDTDEVLFDFTRI
jgi:hypothetical protein